MSDPAVTAAPSPLATARSLAVDIKVAHSVFALPFAILAAFMAGAPGTPGTVAVSTWARFGGQLALVVAAMVTARTVAMIANRVLDRDVDATNPRTKGRALPSGRVSLRGAMTTLVLAALAFAAVCVAFGVAYGNWWPALLAAPVLGWISVYPLLKRFTALCHLYLGSSLALSPLAAALAVAPPSLAQQPALWLLAGMVLFWVAGFDVIYALQDIDTDRRQGTRSIPARLGVRGALRASRILHLAAAGFLVAAARADPRLGVLFAIGVTLVLVLLVAEHATVARWGTTRIALAFFTANGLISCLLGVLGVADVLVD